MILVDTSIWIDHFNKGGDSDLYTLLAGESVLTHEYVIGEIVMGSLKNRQATVTMLNQLPKVTSASNAEVLTLIEAIPLHGSGLTFIDAHLLAAARASPPERSIRLWTRDKRLQEQARLLGIDYQSWL